MTRVETSQLSELDAVYEALKHTDQQWLETTLLERWKAISSRKNSHEDGTLPQEASQDGAMTGFLSGDELSQKNYLLKARLNLSQLDAKDKEIRFRRMADMAMVGMFEVGADGTLNYANDTWYEMTGYPRGDFPPLDWVKVIREDDRGWFADTWSRLTSGETLTFEIRFVKPYVSDDFIDGERLKGVTWAAAAAYAEIDAEGNVKNVLGTIVDISRHKWMLDFQERRKQEAIELKRQQEAFMDMTSHEARNPLAAISLCVESILETCEDILETPGEQVLTSRDTIESMLDGATTIMACVMHQKTIIDDVLTLSKLNSGLLQTFPVEVQPLQEILQALKIFEVELQQAEIELDFTIDNSFNQQAIDYVLLDPVRIRQILINLLTNAIKFTKEEPLRRITVSLAASKTPPPKSIEGVQYLCSKPAGAPQPAEDTVYVAITVKDTGRGIDESSLENLFQRFQQGSPKTHVKYGGSGLGLFICKELTRLQGGQIGVTSERGTGSTFSFYVRATKCKPATTTSTQTTIPLRTKSKRSSTLKSPRPELKGTRSSPGDLNASSNIASHSSVTASKDCHVLLVEDNLVNQRVMAKQLRRAGYTVTIANHGREALEFLQGTHFSKSYKGDPLHIVLSDVEMPVMGGIELSTRIRDLEATNGCKQKLPLIAVTANARLEQQNEALKAGFDAVITKPFRMNSLLPVLERYSPDG